MMNETISTDKVTLVQNSYGRCLSNGQMMETFYKYFLGTGPEVAGKFSKTDFEQQNKLLKHGLNLVIMYAAGKIAGQAGMKRIMESHSRSKMNIEPHLYSLWKVALLKAIAEHDNKFDTRTKEAWTEVLDKGIALLVKGY